MVWQNDIFLLTPGIIKLTYDGIPMDTTPKPGSYCHVYFSKRIIKQGVVTVASKLKTYKGGGASSMYHITNSKNRLLVI